MDHSNGTEHWALFSTCLSLPLKILYHAERSRPELAYDPRFYFYNMLRTHFGE